MPLATVIGLLIFLLVALAVMMLGGNYLQYPVPLAGILILVIEAAATLSIAAVLVRLFVGVKSDMDGLASGEDRKIFTLEEENKRQ